MTHASLGFIGLGVMGAPMCRNLARKSGLPVHAFDLHNPPPEGALGAPSVAEVARRADTIFLSLPGEAEIRQVLREIPKEKTVVDCSTAPVAVWRPSGRREGRVFMAQFYCFSGNNWFINSLSSMIARSR